MHPGKKKGYSISLAVKVTALVIICIVLVSSITNLIIYNLSYHSLKSEINAKIRLLASVSAASIDGDELSTIRSVEDEGNETYLRLQKQLQKIKMDSLGEIRYIYTLAREGDRYFYVLDAEPIEDSSNHSRVGDPFHIRTYPVAAEGFSRPSVEEDPTPDDQFGGVTQSGYAPVRNAAGVVVGAVGVDIDVSVILKEQTGIRWAGAAAFVSSLLLALILGVLFSRYLTKPILTLTSAMKRVAEGDLETSVELHRHDELGLLGDSFNSMIRDLDTAERSLKEYSVELEDKVAQRTAALSGINKEIRDILDNISQAIFTIDGQFRFNPQYSRFACRIFGEVPFEEKNMLDVFFPLEEQMGMRESMSNWLGMVFQSGKRWEDAEALQPVREMAVYPDTRDRGTVKYVRINFKPIQDDPGYGRRKEITKLMVIVQDITERTNLQMEMSAREKEYRDNISQIVEIIKMDQELFQDFITECRDSLVGFEPKLIQLRNDMGNMDLVNDLSRIMHTIKGNARSFNLERIAAEAHGIESIFSSIRKGESSLTDALLDETFRKLDRFNGLFRETADIFNRIMQNRNTDFGKTRGEKRNKEDQEIIKVKVRQIDRLAELLGKADNLILSNGRYTLDPVLGPGKTAEVEGVFREAGEQLKVIRKVSFNRLFARFPRMIRDISMELEKSVRFEAKGEDLLVDKFIYDNLSEPIIHIIRNSLDHGIEKPGERAELGKPEEGTIRLAIEQRDEELTVEIRDDGRGLDYERIREKAVVKGLITAEDAESISDADVLELIFLPGFSTNDFVTNVSGRGVGMFAVRTSVEETLGGRVRIESRKDEGTRITLCIPTKNGKEEWQNGESTDRG